MRNQSQSTQIIQFLFKLADGPGESLQVYFCPRKSQSRAEKPEGQVLHVSSWSDLFLESNWHCDHRTPLTVMGFANLEKSITSEWRFVSLAGVAFLQFMPNAVIQYFTKKACNHTVQPVIVRTSWLCNTHDKDQGIKQALLEHNQGFCRVLNVKSKTF